MISGIYLRQNLSDCLENVSRRLSPSVISCVFPDSFANLSLPSVLSSVFPDDGAEMSLPSVIPRIFPDDDPENRFSSGKRAMFPDDKFRQRAGGFGLRIVLGCVGLE